LAELSPYFVQRLHARHTAVDSSVPLPARLEEHLAIHEYLRVVRVHLVLIASILASALLVSGIAVFTMTPVFSATAMILIEPHPPQVLDIKELMVEPAGSDEHDYYKTQYALLRGRSLAAEVIHNLGLQNNPILVGRGRPQGLVASWWSNLSSRMAHWKPDPPDKAEPGFSDNSGAELSDNSGADPRLINAYLDRLKIEPEFGTRLVKISFNSSDPKLSATIANAHADAYLHQGVELRAQTTQTAQRFLETKLVELRDRVERSEAALNSYRHDKGIVEFSTNGSNEILLKRLVDLNQSLTEAETKRISLEAQAALISKGDYKALPDVVSSPMVQSLEPELAKLEADYASMSSRFTTRYAPAVALKAKLDDTRARLDTSVGEIVRSIKLQDEAAATKEQELRLKLDREKARALALNDTSLQDAILARDVDTNRQLYESVLKRMKEMGVAAEVVASNVSLVDSATPPLSPASPRKMLTMMLSGLFGLLGGLGVAFFLDHLDDTLKASEETERYLHLPTLAVIPDMHRLNGHSHRGAFANWRRGSGVEGRSIEKYTGKYLSGHGPLSLAIEAFRSVRGQILLSRAGEPPRNLLITSAVAEEGKSVTAVNVAIAFAQKGRRVLLIDADLRKSRCHQLLRLEPKDGLAEVLTGQVAADAVIAETDVGGLSLLGAGAVPPDPPELLGSARMGKLLNELGANYEQIIIDSAPIMPVSDSVMLSPHVDGVLIVVGRATPRHIVKRACERLGGAGAKILGVLLNQITEHTSGYYTYNPYSYSSYDSKSSDNGDGDDDGQPKVVFD